MLRKMCGSMVSATVARQGKHMLAYAEHMYNHVPCAMSLDACKVISDQLLVLLSAQVCRLSVPNQHSATVA